MQLTKFLCAFMSLWFLLTVSSLQRHKDTKDLSLRQIRSYFGISSQTTGEAAQIGGAFREKSNRSAHIFNKPFSSMFLIRYLVDDAG